MNPAPSAPKACSICGVSFPRSEFTYGKRESRSYCKTCSVAERGAYASGGVEAARAYRDEMRRKWKRS